jgi:hypothetical protein
VMRDRDIAPQVREKARQHLSILQPERSFAMRDRIVVLRSRGIAVCDISVVPRYPRRVCGNIQRTRPFRSNVHLFRQDVCLDSRFLADSGPLRPQTLSFRRASPRMAQ